MLNFINKSFEKILNLTFNFDYFSLKEKLKKKKTKQQKMYKLNLILAMISLLYRPLGKI